MDSFNKEEHFIKFEKEKSELKKEQFIKQIKTGLGEHIKNHGNKIHTISAKECGSNKIEEINPKIVINKMMNLIS